MNTDNSLNQNVDDVNSETIVPEHELQQSAKTSCSTVNSANMPINKEDAPRQITNNCSSSKQQPENEMSPTKSRNKRKNDAKRRSGNSKRTTPSSIDSQKEKPTPPQLAQISPTSDDQVVANSFAVESVAEDIKITSKIVQLAHNKQENSTLNSLDKEGKSNNASPTKPKQAINTSSKDNYSEYKELKEQLKIQNNQIGTLVDQVKQQISRIGELEKALVRTNKTCNQLEKLLEQEILSRNGLETENSSLNQTIMRLKKQIAIHEKNRFSNDELVRVLNATLMERETEISILKLKLTRLQTNPSSAKTLTSNTSISSVKQEPVQSYVMPGRSNSEFDRNSYVRSSLIAEAASVRASANHLKSDDQDASVWATVPEELTPSKRPAILERSFQPIYGETLYTSLHGIQTNQKNFSFTSFERDKRYKTLPHSMKSPTQEFNGSHIVDPDQAVEKSPAESKMTNSTNQLSECRVTNLDDSNSTSQSSGNRTTSSYSSNENRQLEPTTNIGLPIPNPNLNSIVKTSAIAQEHITQDRLTASSIGTSNILEESHYSGIARTNTSSSSTKIFQNTSFDSPKLPERTPTTPVNFTNKMKRLFIKFGRQDSATSSQSKTDLYNTSTPKSSPFIRGAIRSTMVASPDNIQAQISPARQVMSFQTDKPFAEWDTNMLCDWLTMIGLSMYSSQCRRWVECGANIMDATPNEVDKGLGITNHLHRKKLRLAISEINGDCDKITKAAAKLDYLWVARWLDDIGLPQYKETFINARVDGRVLNYLTVEDLTSMGVKSVLHHASIRCGIRVLRSIQFDLQLLRRRATADEIEQMNCKRQNMNQVGESSIGSSSKLSKGETAVSSTTEVPLWTCHRVMEWLRLIDFAEFAPNLRGSGVHGGLIVFEDGFNIDAMCSLLSIPNSRTLLRRHLSTFFKDLIGEDIINRKRHYQDSPSNQQLSPLAEIKSSKKMPLWFSKLKHPKVGQDMNDEYLCPMYPVEPQFVRSQKKGNSANETKETHLFNIPESINI